MLDKSFLNRIQLINGDLHTQMADAVCVLIPQNLDLSGEINLSLDAATEGRFDAFLLEHIYKPRAGEVYALPGLGLAARNIFVGIVPRYRSDVDMQDSDIAGVTRKMMELGRCMLLKNMALPLLDTGSKLQFPVSKRVRLICQGISERMTENFEDIFICSKDRQILTAFDQRLRQIAAS